MSMVSTEMSTRNVRGDKGRPEGKADCLTAMVANVELR